MSIRYRGGVTSPQPSEFSLDPYAGQKINGKPIFDLNGVVRQLDGGSEIKASNGVITYTFLDLNHLTGLYNNPNYGFEAAAGLSPFTAQQRAEAREAIQLWDDLIPQTFKETKGLGADIQFSNSTDPAQAYAYYPQKQGWKFQSDVFIHDPASNWTNAWFSNGGYGTTTLVHELGHTLGLSHPGNYNFSDDNDGDGKPDPITYEGDAFYAQDTQQYTIMSYFEGDYTGSRIIEWSTLQYSNPQGPLVHDIYVIQQKYGADPTTRAGDTVYGFGSTADRDMYDFAKNPYPYFAVYDAGGNDTLNLSGFTASQFVNLQPGSFSSIGAGSPTADVFNAARADLFKLAGLAAPAPRTQAQIDATVNSFMDANAADIRAFTKVSGIRASEHDNFAIAYNTIIENAIGGSNRDLLWGNDVGNRLEGRGGNDVLNGFKGADTLVGGTGNDLFEFSTVEKGDRIADFTAGDKIDLSKIDAVAGGADNAFAYIGGAAFSKVAGQLRYASGLLEGDVNGDGVADFSVALTGAPSLNPVTDLVF